MTETQESAIPARPILQCENNMENSSIFSIKIVVIPIIPIVQSSDIHDLTSVANVNARGQNKEASW